MIFQVKKKSDFVAARVAKSAEACKKEEEIEALQEEIKREKDGGGCRMSMCSHANRCVCVCVCVCVSEKDQDKRLCVCACARERVYHNEKKVTDEIATTSDTSDSSRNQQQAQCKEKINMRKRLVFFFSVNHCHPHRKKKEKQFTKPTHASVYLFQDLDWSQLYI